MHKSACLGGAIACSSLGKSLMRGMWCGGAKNIEDEMSVTLTKKLHCFFNQNNL